MEEKTVSIVLSDCEYALDICNTLANLLSDKGLDVRVHKGEGDGVFVFSFPNFADDGFLSNLMAHFRTACREVGYWRAKRVIRDYLDVWEQESKDQALTKVVWRWIASRDVRLYIKTGEEIIMRDRLLEVLANERDLWKTKCEVLKREYESSRPSVSVIAMEVEKNEKYEKLKSDYDELEFKYDLQKAENVRLAYINARIGIIAKAKCPEIAAFLERMKLMREQSIKDMMERAEDLNEDDAWGNTFEQAAQKCSSEEWEEGAKKAEEQTKSEDESITH